MDTGTYEFESTFTDIPTEPLLKILEDESPSDDTLPGADPYDTAPSKKDWGWKPR
jgi:hypothetical protein